MTAGGQEIGQHGDLLGAQLDAAIDSTTETGFGYLQKGGNDEIESIGVQLPNPVGELTDLIVGGRAAATVGDQEKCFHPGFTSSQC